MIILRFPDASWICEEPIKILEIRSENPWEELKSKLTWEHSHPWIGFLTYEMGVLLEKGVPTHASDLPWAWFMQPKTIRPFFQKEGSVKLVKKRFHERNYGQKVERIKNLIRAGDVYQVNLSHSLEFELVGKSEDLFYKLTSSYSPPFSAFVKTPFASFVSLSPERLLRKHGQTLVSSPIKGTMPRGKDVKEDNAYLLRLVNSKKEKAELFMITDLVRNDLGKVSRIGTVEVKENSRIVFHPNVMHQHATVASQALDLHPVDILKAVFPGGSITGCPKRRAMEIIYELEGRPRGIYTGAIGYITAEGDFDFNIAIRTLTIRDKRALLPLGSGITIDSEIDAEFQETLDKGRPFLF